MDSAPFDLSLLFEGLGTFLNALLQGTCGLLGSVLSLVTTL